MEETASPSLRSRTVPTKLHTAPTPLFSRRRAATSVDRSKSSVWMETRGGVMAVLQNQKGRGSRRPVQARCRQQGAFFFHHLVQLHQRGRGGQFSEQSLQ